MTSEEARRRVTQYVANLLKPKNRANSCPVENCQASKEVLTKLTYDKYFDIKTNMNYNYKTREQLINESAELRQRIEDLAARETKQNRTEIVSNAYLIDHKRIIFIQDNNK